jgi:hypothetical protein
MRPVAAPRSPGGVEGQPLLDDAVARLRLPETQVERAIPVVRETWMDSRARGLRPRCGHEESGKCRGHCERTLHLDLSDADAQRKLDQHGDRPPLGLEDGLRHVPEVLPVDLER